MQSHGSVNGWKMINEVRFLGSWIKYEYHATVKPTFVVFSGLWVLASSARK